MNLTHAQIARRLALQLRGTVTLPADATAEERARYAARVELLVWARMYIRRLRTA